MPEFFDPKCSKELNDEELKQVSGGIGTYNGVTYFDNDVFVSSSEYSKYTAGNSDFEIYVIRNCVESGCDVWTYQYKWQTKQAINGMILYSNTTYGNIPGNKIDLVITSFSE